MWVPKGIITRVRKVYSRFLWAGSKEDSVLPWVAWGKVARPKEWGGVGYKRPFRFRPIFSRKIWMEAYFNGKPMDVGGQKEIY